MKIGTALHNATTTLKIQWVPERIVLVSHNATPVVADITGLKVNVLGDGVICDLGNKGIFGLNAVDNVAYNSKEPEVVLADGIISGKTTEITIINSAATDDWDVYALGDNKGAAYVLSLRQTILASSGAKFENIGYISLPDMAATDEFNVTFVDGLVQKYSDVGLKHRLGVTQANIEVPGFSNLNGTMDLISFIPTSEQTVYVMKFAPAGNVE